MLIIARLGRPDYPQRVDDDPAAALSLLALILIFRGGVAYLSTGPP
ncbi:MAG: hypothetical protein WCC47_09940 [Pseudonocardiaceae bacterium]